MVVYFIPVSEQLINYNDRNCNDRDLKNIANKVASERVNDEKHRRVNNALIGSIPVVVGMNAALENSKLSNFAKLKTFAKNSGALAVWFAAMDATFKVKNEVDKHSKISRNFAEKHPLLNSFGLLGVSLLAGAGAVKGGRVAMKKLSPFISKQISKIGLEKFINESNFMKGVSKLVKKVPSSIREFSKTLLAWAPTVLCLSTIFRSIHQEAARNEQAIEIYNDLKNYQN